MNEIGPYLFGVFIALILYYFIARFVFSINTIVINLNKQTRYLEFLCKEKGMTEEQIKTIKYDAES
jgi:hypothetical protein